MGPDFRFIHAADLHLGARRWLSSPPRNRELRERVEQADRLAFRALVDWCLKEEAAFLLCSGDIVDRWCRNYVVALSLVEELLRLRDAGSEVVLLLGNHDAQSRMMQSLLLPRYAKVLGRGAPETHVVERFGVAFHGWSCPDVTGSMDVAELYPEPLPDHLNVGLLHTSAEGVAGHRDYAPCSRRTLRNKGYDYWALGHVHARQVLCREPWIVFPGNLQGRGPREGGPKGASSVSVRSGRIAKVEHQPLDAIRFETIELDTSEVYCFADVLARAERELRELCAELGSVSLVVSLVICGVAGARYTLEVPAGARRRAFVELGSVVDPSRLRLEAVWVEPAAELGAFRVDAAA